MVLAGFYQQVSGANPLSNPNPRIENMKEGLRPGDSAGYELGRQMGRITQEEASRAGRALQDLWDNRPQFGLPQIKIDIKIPEIPEIELPKFPEFKFPEISFPKPKRPLPTPKPRLVKPKTLTEQLEEKDFSECNGFIIYATNCIKRVYIPNRNNPISIIDSPFPAQEWLEITNKVNVAEGYQPSTFYDYRFDGAGFTEIDFPNNPETEVRFSQTVRTTLNGERPRGGENELLICGTITIGIRGNGTKTSDVISYLKSTFTNPEVFFYQPGSSACTLPPPSPATANPPPNPSCCMCCPNQSQDIDYARIKRIIQDTLKEQKFKIDVPVCKCEFNESKAEWEAKIENKTLEFFASTKEQAEQQAVLHFENAKQLADMCVSRNKDTEAIASLPLSFQIRHEGRTPQLVIQCAEQYKDTDGKLKYKSAMYPITVPHWKGTPNDKPRLPVYKKGNWEGIYVLSDNSKITINAADEANCIKILNAIKPWIPKEFKEGSYFKGGKINVEIKQTVVKPMYGRYFGQGQKNGKPDWRVDFP
ncbi:hypothetical protein [Anabaena azotica]|uniref:Uncharacterized protein n=1 Tax=Anabaena azotica FACHB-119 TaxID=947527 RepID=A0ABR8D8A0_9NOST|nr:hypothetical protein [Anabaena azotica]MBD2503418.1 hypothetical protein [Anabaena azotica FACHB-119]